MATLFALLLLAAPPELRHTDEGAKATVHALASEDGATSYLVETEECVVAVDAPTSAGAARAAREKLQSLKKPLLALLVTSRERTTFAAELLLGQPETVPLYSTAGVSESMATAPGAVQIDRPLQDRQTIELGGARFTAHELGSGQAAFVLLGKPPQAFVGDLLVRGVPPDLARRKLGAWLLQLEQAKRLFYGLRIFWPGHGAEATFAALGDQRTYLSAVREAVAAVAKGRKELDDAARSELTTRLLALRPGEPLGTLAGAGADAVAAELAAESVH